MNLGLFLTDAATSSVDLTPFIDKLTGSITPAQVLTILGSVVGIGMAFVLMWFGVRKAISIFRSALVHGRLKA